MVVTGLLCWGVLYPVRVIVHGSGTGRKVVGEVVGKVVGKVRREHCAGVDRRG